MAVAKKKVKKGGSKKKQRSLIEFAKTTIAKAVVVGPYTNTNVHKRPYTMFTWWVRRWTLAQLPSPKLFSAPHLPLQLNTSRHSVRRHRRCSSARGAVNYRGKIKFCEASFA